MKHSKTLKTALMLPLLVGALSNTSAAQHRATTPSGHRIQGVYGDLMAGYGSYDISGGQFKDSSENGLAGVLNLGYQFNQNIALEIGLGYSARLSGKFILPVNCNTDVYAKLGLGYGVVSVKETTTLTTSSGTQTIKSENTGAYLVGNIGAGASHWFSDRWAMTGEVNYVSNAIGSDDFDMNAVEAVAGVSYHF